MKLKSLVSWLSTHRYIFGMNPKNWTEQDEISYQKYARSGGDIRGFYS